MLTFEQLFRDHHSDVVSFAIWLTGNRSEAEDLASETLVRAWVRRDRLRTETLRAYLLAIARNLFLSRRRREAVHDELSEGLPDGEPDPQRRASSKIELDRVRCTLALLPEADRTALILRTEHSLSYAEIARVLEISEGTARVRVHRARRRLLAGELKTEGGSR